MDTASVNFYLYFSSEDDDAGVVTAVTSYRASNSYGAGSGYYSHGAGSASNSYGASTASNSYGAGPASNSYRAGSASNSYGASLASNSFKASSATKSDSDGIGLGAALGITGKLCIYVYNSC